MGDKDKKGSKPVLSHLVHTDKAQDYLNASGIFLLGINADGIINFANSKICELLGCKAKDLVGHSWVDRFIPSVTRDELLAYFDRVLTSDSYKGK